MEKEYKSFSEFYPFHLTEHSDRLDRRLHFTGTLHVIIILFLIILTHEWILFILLPFFGYGFAWVGHFIVERNMPAISHILSTDLPVIL